MITIIFLKGWRKWLHFPNVSKAIHIYIFHCVKWAVPWSWNYMIRTRIFRKYEHTVRYRDQDTWRVGWVAGSVFVPIRTFSEAWKIRFPDTPLIRSLPRSWYLFILPDLPKIPTYHIRVMHVVRLTHLTRYDPLLNRICTIRHSIARFSQTKPHDTTRITREIPWYVKFHCQFPCVKFHGTLSFIANFHTWNSTVHRVSRVKFHGTLSFIVNFHTRNSTAHRVSRVKLHDTLR